MTNNREKQRYSKKIVTGKMVVQFVYLGEPNQDPQYGKGKYMLTAIAPKDAPMWKEIKHETKLLIQAKGWNLQECVLPWKDGDEKAKIEALSGQYYIKPTSKNKPCVVNGMKELFPAENVGFGSECRLVITLGTFNMGGRNKGVTCFLDSVQCIRANTAQTNEHLFDIEDDSLIGDEGDFSDEDSFANL